MSARLELCDISKSFRDPAGVGRSVLKGLSFSLEPGGRALIEGPSGSGKSTLMNVLSGLLLPNAGDVRIGDVTVNRLSVSRRDRFRAAHIGYIFQTFNLISPLSVLENLTIPARLSGLSSPDLDARATELLSRFGLADHLHKPPYQLSVGQRQRVAVARAMMHAPGLILADEPTANLDHRAAETVIEALADLNAAGVTLLVASHDPRMKGLDFTLCVDLSQEGGTRC